MSDAARAKEELARRMAEAVSSAMGTHGPTITRDEAVILERVVPVALAYAAEKTTALRALVGNIQAEWAAFTREESKVVYSDFRERMNTLLADPEGQR